LCDLLSNNARLDARINTEMAPYTQYAFGGVWDPKKLKILLNF